MLDSYARKLVQPAIEKGAKSLHTVGFTANTVTWIAMLLGVGSAAVYTLGYPILAVIILWISGYLDSVDGTMARMTKTTPWGNIMDITFDRVVEGSIMMSILVVHPDASLPLALDLFGILVVITTFLVAGNVIENSGIKGFHYNPGLMERTEAFTVFSLMMLIPSFLQLITWIFFILLALTAIKHLIDVHKSIKSHSKE